MKALVIFFLSIAAVITVMWMIAASYRVGYAEGKEAGASEVQKLESKHCYNWWFAGDSKLRLKQTKELLCKSRH